MEDLIEEPALFWKPISQTWDKTRQNLQSIHNAKMSIINDSS